jgi:HEAT repeat protein
MNRRRLVHVLTGGATAIALFLVFVVVGGLLRPASSRRGEATASGSSREFLASTNKVALARELARQRDVGAVGGLIQGLRKDSDPAVRAACAESLGRLGDRRAVPDLATRLIEDPDPSVRRAIVLAFEASGMIRDIGYYDTLRKKLNDDKAPEVRREVVCVLSRLATEDALTTAARAVTDCDPTVRLAVVQAFAASTNEHAGRVLSVASLDSSVAVRTAAAEALHKAGARLLPNLREAVAAARDAESRLAAIRLLPRPVAPQAIPILLSALERERADETRPSVLFDEVVEALASMGPSGAGSIAAEAIREDYRGTAEAAAARACVRIGGNAAQAITSELLRWRVFPDPAELRIWIAALGDLGDPCAIPALRRALAQGLDGMPDAVEKARRAIEAKSATPTPAIAPEPGLLADEPVNPRPRLREGQIRFANPNPSFAGFPSNGVVRLHLIHAMGPPDAHPDAFRTPLVVDLVCRAGTWDRRFPVDADYSKRSFEGMMLDVRETSGSVTFVFDVLGYSDFWRGTAFSHYEVTLPRSTPGLVGTYTGHTDFQPVRGSVEGAAWELPPHPPALPPLAPGEHPRLLFRPADVPALRERARTAFGRQILQSMRDWMGREKALYREPLDWATNWEPGCDLAIAHGLMATLFDDPAHGRRSAPLILDRSRTPPYGGEHGERMPGPMLHYPYAVDLNHGFLTAGERAEVIENRCWLTGLYNVEYGPLGVIAANRHVFGLPAVASLTLLREKGSFSLQEPVTFPSVTELPPDTALAADTALLAVNDFLAGSMPSNWLVAGPFPVEDGVDPLAGIGGCEAARPTLDTPISGTSARFRALSPSAIRTLPPPFPNTQYIELPVGPGEQFFLYALLKVTTRQGAQIEPFSTGGPKWAGLWLNGRPIAANTVVSLEPGLHRALVATRSSYANPTFAPARLEWATARHRRYQVMSQRWQLAKQRHAETGEVQDAAETFDLLCRDIRATLRRDRLTRTGSKGGKTFPLPPSAGMSPHFVLALRSVTGMGLDPDTPHPILISPHEFLRTTGDDEFIPLIGLAPDSILPDVLREFHRRFPPDRLARQSPLNLAILFTTYPLDASPAR